MAIAPLSPALPPLPALPAGPAAPAVPAVPGTARRPGRRLRGVLLVVLAAVPIAWALTQVLPPRQTGSVAVPPVGASPRRVVETYIAALNAHDCATARAVTTGFARWQVMGWCHGVARLSGLRVGTFVHEGPRYSGLPASASVVTAPVTFDLHWRLLHASDSMSGGPTQWGYELVRTSPGAPWLIDDEGAG